MKFKTRHLKTDPQGMFRVRYPDGVLSEDYYNLTRAKDFAAKMNESLARQKRLEAQGEVLHAKNVQSTTEPRLSTK